MIKFSKLLLIFLLFIATRSIAQEKNGEIIVGERKTIQSSVLKESRDLLIYTPGKATTKLPLIIVFDGDGLFSATVSATRFMNYYSEIPQMPEAVIIGIENTDRNRDMPIPQQYGEQKGEDNFLKFIKDEIIPWAAKNFSLNGHTIAIGHSQGGLFVSYMLGTSPERFPWGLALDAPMNVDPKTNTVKEMISKAVKDVSNKVRYASIEAVYGWKDEWTKYFSESNSVMTKKLSDESHESMAFEGVYEGLKFLFKDFAPPRKEMNLGELRNFYHSISDKYGYEYEIPLRILTASTSRKIPENRKAQMMELLNYAETKYGSNEMITELKAKTALLTNATNSIVDSFLALPSPTPEQIKNYIGSWSGQFITKEGKELKSTIEISLKEGKTKLFTSFDAYSPENKQEPEVLHVTKEGKLLFGIKNRGGGIIINTLELDKKGSLVGEGMWLGFTIPGDAPPDEKKQLTFLLNTPTKFILQKQ
jgi:hypothetical protein